MLRHNNRVLLIAVYCLMLWKFFTLASIAFVAAIAFTIQLQIAGPVLIPVGGILAIYGVITLQNLRQVLQAPYY